MERGTVFRRGLSSRCPQCGDGHLFKGYCELWERCEECELLYRREHGAMTGAMYISAVMTEVVAALICVAMFLLTDWSVKTGLLVGAPVVAFFAFFTYPRAMALWVAIDYWTDLQNGAAWAKPR
jgi:uncharacterized protein (DUF983 family)